MSAFGLRCLAGLAACAAFLAAGPIDFGMAELNAAMAERKLRWKNQIELSLDAPETFRIEPLRAGGAQITGGDLRGLLYGLLEAADQIRTSGKLLKASGTPAASLRGVRIVLDAALEQAQPEFWRAYFQMLARNRFNRVHVVFGHLEAPYTLAGLLSQTAADYAIDFTLGVAGGVSAEELAHALALCPAIRGVALDGSGTQDAVLFAIRVAGRRVTLDLDGAKAEQGLIEAAVANGVPLLRATAAWPPSFEAAPGIEPDQPGAHPLFYWAMGRLGYDPKSSPPKTMAAVASSAEFGAARDAVVWMAAAQQSNLGGSDYVASASEARHYREQHVASAKFSPPDIAERLYAVAGQLLGSASVDLQVLAAMAREQADQQVAALDLGAATKVPPPSRWTHTPPASAPSERPLPLTLRFVQPKTVSAVRLHYRTLDPAASSRVIEMPAATDVSFAIPASEISGNWDVLYYFEILDAQGNAWFEPDPLVATPSWTVHIIAPHTGRN